MFYPQVSYLAHQASLANLPVSSQVMELSLEPRARYRECSMIACTPVVLC